MKALNKIQQRIIDLTQENWVAVQKPLLLAPLGGTLRKEFPGEVDAELAGRKLKIYLEAELGQRVKVLQNPDKPIEWGLIPGVSDAAAVSFQGDGLVADTSQPRSTSSPPTSTQYNSELWNAFAWPIPPGVNRFIKLDGSLEVQERPENIVALDGYILIEKDETVGSRSPIDRNYFRVAGKIEEWAKKHDINLGPFKEARVRVSQKSLLDLVLETIPPHDLQLVSMPMHLIKALNDKKL
jgi:hypothetical protein